MALNYSTAMLKNAFLRTSISTHALERNISTTSALNKISVGRYKPLEGRSQLLTFEQATKPHLLGHMKSWNTWNTSNLVGGRRQQLTTIEDMFIRRFIYGAWHSNVLGEQIIIKRQHNMIRIAFIISKRVNPQAVYFMTGFSEEMLAIWLHCPVKIEIQTRDLHEGFAKVILPA